MTSLRIVILLYFLCEHVLFAPALPSPVANRACPTCATYCGTRASPGSVGGRVRVGVFAGHALFIARAVGQVADTHVLQRAIRKVRDESVSEKPLARGCDLLGRIEVFDREYRLSGVGQQLQ